MEHLAIDLGGRESQICVRASDGTILEERRCRTAALAAELAGRPRSRVIVETCSEAFRMADAAIAAGHEVRVVPATLVRTLGVGARRTKTDRRDAQVLSEVSCRIDLPSVHVPSREARARKTLCGMRDGLVGARTKLISTVRGWLRSEGQGPRTGDAATFPARVRALWTASACPASVERQLQAIDALSGAIANADRDLHAITRADSWAASSPCRASGRRPPSVLRPRSMTSAQIPSVRGDGDEALSLLTEIRDSLRRLKSGPGDKEGRA